MGLEVAEGVNLNRLITMSSCLVFQETEKFLLQVVFDGQAENEQLDGQPADADDKVVSWRETSSVLGDSILMCIV